MRYLLIIFAVLLLGSAIICNASEPLVGFVNHFPWINKDMDQIPASGSNAVIFRAVAGMQSEDGKINFDSVDWQIDFAEKNNLKTVLLIEANPIYAPAWVKKKCEAAGEMQMTSWGTVDSMPSMTSKVFKDWHDSFVKAVIEHVKERDKNRVVVAYQPGAEWWYSANARYNSGDQAAFRKWLAVKYGSIKKLNKVWQADYRKFDEIEPNYLSMESFIGDNEDLSRITPGDDLYHDTSWSTNTDLPIEAGKQYVFRMRCRTQDSRGDGAHLEIAWRTGKGEVPMSMSRSSLRRGSHGWSTLEYTVTAPAGASTAWLLMKMRGTGRVDFDNIFFAEKGSSKNLAPNPGFESGGDTPNFYHFDNWTNGKQVKPTYIKEKRNRYLSISIPGAADTKHRWKNWSAVSYDWSMFSYNFFGDYIEGFCKLVKDQDPSRPTIGYLTYSFAFPVEWDYVQESAMALDVILPKLKHLDMIGMQICSADGDPVRITGTIDLARKYGKPILDIDLLDFTSGVALGYKGMDAVTQAAIAHGATGAFYYCWYGTPDYNFHTGMPSSDLNKMLTSARESMSRIIDKKVETRVAIVQPILPSVFTDSNGQKNDFRDFVGLYKAVLDLQLCPDIWTLQELTSQKPNLRAKYDVIFLPRCEYCPVKAWAVLQDFQQRGGWIISFDLLPTWDETCKLYSLSQDKFYDSERMGISGRDYLGGVYRTTHAGNTPPLFIETDKPDVLYARRSKMLVKLSKFLDMLNFRRQIRIDKPNVGCTIYTGGGEKLFFITNRSKLTELKAVKIQPGVGYKFKSISGGSLTSAKSSKGIWTLDVRLDASACIISYEKS